MLLMYLLNVSLQPGLGVHLDTLVKERFKDDNLITLFNETHKCA